MADTPTLPARQLFDLAGPTPQDRHKQVRLFPHDDGLVWDVYGEHKQHPGAALVAGSDLVGHVAQLSGPLVEVKPGRRWTIGGWTLTRAAGCGCGGRGAALRAWPGP